MVCPDGIDKRDQFVYFRVYFETSGKDVIKLESHVLGLNHSRDDSKKHIYLVD